VAGEEIELVGHVEFEVFTDVDVEVAGVEQPDLAARRLGGVLLGRSRRRNRVGGRSALLTAVAEQAMEESRVYMDAAYAADGTAEERLLKVAGAYAQFARERPHEFRILVEPPDEPGAIARIVDLTREQNGKLANAIRDGVAEGAGRSDLDPDDLATVFLATINGLLALAWRPGGMGVRPEKLDDLLALYVATVSDGIRTRPSA
jgi:AcrR family transcriptional regulator